MPTPNLTKVRKNKELHKVFAAYLKSKGYTNLYTFVLANDDPAKSLTFFNEDINGAEERFVGRLKNVMIGAWAKTKTNVENEMRAQGLDPTGADKPQVWNRIFRDRQFVRIYEQLMGKVEELFEELSKSDDFLKSKPYKEYVRKEIKKHGKALRKDLKMEAEVDDIIGLAFAVQTGDTGSTRSLSNLIAEAEGKATKKKTKGATIVANMQKALGRLGL
ncbi:hypothetical protein [uncultured Roseobacter sp.]|uniref:hypothetical protein n=1 Tax=uncultured Roseobacter sp. TaxID=114847 RepID=UPI002624C12B|nr:hypothetical protein [uncultured Roseobacter sp.]